MKKNKHIGPRFDDLLKEEGTLEQTEEAARDKILSETKKAIEEKEWKFDFWKGSDRKDKKPKKKKTLGKILEEGMKEAIKHDKESELNDFRNFAFDTAIKELSLLFMEINKKIPCCQHCTKWRE